MRWLRLVPSVDHFRRVLAVTCATLVLALGIFAASPDLHGRLHVDHGLGDDGCAIAVFSGGVSTPVAAIAVPLPPVAWRIYAHVAPGELLLSSPRFLRQPGRGPPLA